ncbi:MAG: lipoate--protein ligase [Actinomycetota bacterium]
MPTQIRIINFGDVPYLDSQAIYHSVAHAFGEGSQDTITIMSPAQTYVSIGLFQELAKEVDVGYCRENNIPIVRREVGGGAVLLDSGQLFFHFIFNKRNLTRDIKKLYQLFLTPPIKAYKKLGLDVYYRPINDLHIDGRKIGGTGAAEIGNSMVIVGSFMFDFNHELMARVLKVPSEKFRDKVYKNIKEYVTTIKRECTEKGLAAFSKDKITEAFLGEVSSFLGRPLNMKEELNQAEKEQLGIIRERLSSKDWLHKRGKSLEQKVKITADLNLYEGNYKCEGGLVRITTAVRNNRLEDVNISGDFTLMPSNALPLIEEKLEGVELDSSSILEIIRQCYKDNEIRSPGIKPEDFLEAIKQVIKDKF